MKITSDLKEFSSATSPMILRAGADSGVESLLVCPKVVAALQRFAGKYKSQEDYKRFGRAHQYITEAFGAGDVSAFFSNVQPVSTLDIGEVKGGAN